MDKKRILNALVNKYKLRPNLIAVLDVLMDGKKYSYLELSKSANVPKTKVYEIVNELNQSGLVDFFQASKGSTLYYMSDVRKNIMKFLQQKIDSSLDNYQETIDILEEEKDIEEKTLVQNAKQYVFGALRVISESDNICVLSRRRSAPAIFYPIDRDDYYKLRHSVSETRETLTGTKQLTRIMFEETIKAVKEGKNFTYIMTVEGFNFFLKRYEECFGIEKTRKYIKQLPEYLRKNNHSVFVLCETNPLSLYTTNKRMILVITESRGEIAGIHTNQKKIVEVYRNLFQEMLYRSKPIEQYLQRVIL